MGADAVDGFRRDLTALVDDELARLLEVPAAEATAGAGQRGLMRLVKLAVVAHLDEGSRWSGRPEALRHVPEWTAALLALQNEDGLLSSGDNLVSPPDTSFTVNDLLLVLELLAGRAATGAAGADLLAGLAASLTAIARRVTPALVGGGVHTPNHRWELAAALSGLDAREPQPDVARRAEEWLAEGVDVYPDGLYSERSANYAAGVSNPCLLLLAEQRRRPELLEVVHRNLHATALLTDPDGVVETVHSRRQDQGRAFSAAPFAIQYRRFAAAGCPVCAAAALAAPRPPTGLAAANALAEILLRPELGRPLGVPAPEAAPVDRAGAESAGEPRVHRFASSGLVLVEHASSRTTVYGGSDVPLAGRVASGLACNPTFLRWRSGSVVLEAVRLSRTFFGLGPFRGGEPEPLPGAAESVVHRLRERVEAPYHQPLPVGSRRADGRYALQHEGRFAAAMSFSERDHTSVSLETELVVTAAPGRVSVAATFSGVATAYAFELTFRPGGVLTGVRPLASEGAYELVSGYGTYAVDGDRVRFGPGGGTGPDQPAAYDPGEAYTFLRGTDATEGLKVYVTGRTPGECLVEIEALDPPGGVAGAAS